MTTWQAQMGAVAVWLLSLLVSPPIWAQQRFLTIGSGAVTGVYYAAGGGICRFINKDLKDHGYRCTVKYTGGSVANINAVMSGHLDFGLVQSDAQYNAVKGARGFDSKAQSRLRSVFSLHAEPLTLVVHKDARIRSLADLHGKRVNIGNPGSGTRVSVNELLQTAGLKVTDFSRATELRADEHGAALCAKKIDAFFYVTGHPSANIQDPITTCGAQLVNISGAGVDRWINANPFYSHTRIAAGTYPGQKERVDTYGMLSTVVTTAEKSDEDVYLLTRTVFENLEDFRKLHPSFQILEPSTMIHSGQAALMHPGAAKYFREKGLLP